MATTVTHPRFAESIGGPATESSDFAAHLHAGLLLLWQAHRYADRTRADIWDYAVEIDELRRLQLTGNDFRWLVASGYVQHARERTLIGDLRRTFDPPANGVFCKRSGFVLTESGATFVQEVLEPSGGHSVPGDSATIRQRPHWDAGRRELRVGDAVLKRFRVPAANQELIFAVFQEEGWPTRIDDPLPQDPDIDPKRRLNESIKRLNRNQSRHTIRFYGDGHGEGICWEWAAGSQVGDGS